MKKVFQAHPKADKIFIVNGMPFLKENSAQKHCDDLKISYDEIKVVGKGDKPAKLEKTPEQVSAEKAVADAKKAKATEAKKVEAAAKKKAKEEALVAKKAKAAADKSAKKEAALAKKAKDATAKKA